MGFIGNSFNLHLTGDRVIARFLESRINGFPTASDNKIAEIGPEKFPMGVTQGLGEFGIGVNNLTRGSDICHAYFEIIEQFVKCFIGIVRTDRRRP